MEFTLPPPPPPAVADMREEREATLLAVVEGLVERIGRIRDTLQRRRRGRHPVGAFAQARYRIVRLLRIVATSFSAFIRALARSIRILAKSRTAASTGGHSFS